MKLALHAILDILRSAQTRAERRAKVRRRAMIRRGMKIMLYEINQQRAREGQKPIVFRPEFFDYTVCIAEGGRQSATLHEQLEASVAMTLHQEHARHLRTADDSRATLSQYLHGSQH